MSVYTSNYSIFVNIWPSFGILGLITFSMVLKRNVSLSKHEILLTGNYIAGFQYCQFPRNTVCHKNVISFWKCYHFTVNYILFAAVISVIFVAKKRVVKKLIRRATWFACIFRLSQI